MSTDPEGYTQDLKSLPEEDLPEVTDPNDVPADQGDANQ